MTVQETGDRADDDRRKDRVTKDTDKESFAGMLFGAFGAQLMTTRILNAKSTS